MAPQDCLVLYYRTRDRRDTRFWLCCAALPAPLADTVPREKVVEFLGGIRALIRGAVERTPSHERFIAEHCAATTA